jgi:hypothetical protein
LFAPKGTSRAILDTLTDALDKALDDQNTRKRLLELGGDVPDKTNRGQQALEWPAAAPAPPAATLPPRRRKG